MQRAYIVIPQGTAVLQVLASSPHFASSKARRGKADLHEAEGVLVFPASTGVVPSEPQRVIPGQLSLMEHDG